MSYILSVDTGGTFTDLAAFDAARGSVAYVKHPTTYGDLAEGVLGCIAKAGIAPGEAELIRHGTTLVINALLQRRGARTAFVTTPGFRDTLDIGRGNRAVPFDLRYRRDPPLVPGELCFEIGGRVDGQGREVAPLDLGALDALAAALAAAGVEAVAVSFVNAYRNPAQEAAAADRLRERCPDLYVTAGSALSREWFEYERASTAAANAFVGPQVRRYLTGLDGRLRREGFAGTLAIMGSNAGLLSPERAAAQPVTLVESGPVGGCIGAAAVAARLGIDRAIAFDMGGTTAKCALIDGADFTLTPLYYIGGYAHGFPVRAASVDIVEVGSGGGSIARLDAENRLSVGPESAGSEPGPACYGRGGTAPTVTDANLVLGRLAEGALLGGEMRLDAAAARRAIADDVAAPLGLGTDGAGIARAAQGVLSIATLTMANAVKRISLERGHDPRDFALITYGGAGPLHAAAIARELHIPLVVVPPDPGTFAAFGMLLADARIDATQTFVETLTDEALGRMARWFAEVERGAAAQLGRETGKADCAFDRVAELRYRGQVHAVRTPVPARDDAASVRAAFEALYRGRFGHAQEALPVEAVSLHLIARAATPGPDPNRLRPSDAGRTDALPSIQDVVFADPTAPLHTPVFDRTGLAPGFAAGGPAIVAEYGSTTLVGPDDRFEIAATGDILIRCDSAK